MENLTPPRGFFDAACLLRRYGYTVRRSQFLSTEGRLYDVHFPTESKECWTNAAAVVELAKYQYTLWVTWGGE